MIARNASVAIALAALALAIPVRVPAQARARTVSLSSTLARAGITRARTEPRVVAALVTTGAPRSVQLVVVPVPDDMPRDRNVSYSVKPTGGAAILGRRSGSVNLRSDPEASVLVTIGVQSTALAGRSTVAEVTFSTPGFESVIVPVDLEVTARRGVSVMTTTQLVVARQGGRAKVGFRLTNLGNAVDTVTMRIDGPNGWRIRVDGGGMFVLPVQGTAQGTAVVQVPDEADGTVTLRIIALGSGSERARSTAMIEVPYRDARRRGRLRATPSVATVLEDARRENVALGLLVNGPLWRSIGVEARWSRAPRVGTPGLSRIGSVSGLPHAAFYAENWRLDLGDAGANLSELAGVNAYGRGAAFSMRYGPWTGNSLLTRQSGVVRSGVTRPLMVGAGLERKVNSFALFSNVTHLDNGQASGGQLDALTFGAQTAGEEDGRVRGELAYRRFDGGQGIGVAGETDRRSAKGELRLRVGHAPGGAEAFARSRNQLSGYGSRTLAPWFRSSAGMWYSDDASERTARRQSTARTHVTSTATLPRDVSLGATIEATSLAVRDSAGEQFGGSTRAAGLFATGRISRVSLSGSSMISSERRSSPLDDIAGAAAAEQRLVWRGQAATTSRYGALVASAWAQRPLRSASFQPAQNEIQLAMQDIRIPTLERFVTFGASVTRLGSLGLSAPVVTQRYDARARLPGDVRLSLDVERNPLFITRRPWSSAVRIERDFELPTASTAGRGGLVFQDLNGNGLRDRGEPGLGGIIVRADGEMAVTAADGRYRLASVDRVAPQVDQRSLPYGWLLAVRQGSRRQDFAVVPMSAVEIALQVTNVVGDRGARQNLSNVGVIARDSVDRVWVARVDSSGRAVFEALPPGRYRLTVDLSRLPEPLNTRGDLPEFRTLPNRETLHLTIPLYPRPIRVWRPGGAVADSVARKPVLVAGAPIVEPVVPQQEPTPYVDAAPMVTAPVDRIPRVGMTLSGGSPRIRASGPIVTANVWWQGDTPETLLLAGAARHPRITAHRVRRGEYLRMIATMYLGDERRWRDFIWVFNTDSVRDPDVVLEGQWVLVYTPERTLGAATQAPPPSASRQ